VRPLVPLLGKTLVVLPLVQVPILLRLRPLELARKVLLELIPLLNKA
jgi:hypothetical protein